MSLTEFKVTGTRRYVRALATSQGHHFGGIRAVTDSAEMLDLQEQHDVVSDAYFKRADDELAIALEQGDLRSVRNHIRVSQQYRLEGYRFENLEDDRRHEAQEHLVEAREANVAGSRTCDEVLRRQAECLHGKIA